MNPIYRSKLNEITATLTYNSERGNYLEKVLINFLKNPSTDFDIKIEIKKVVKKDLVDIQGEVSRPSNLLLDFPLYPQKTTLNSRRPY